MLGSLPTQLPPELVLQILECAARDSIATDRAWVVDLALVSRFVDELVRPVLYHTMVVTDECIVEVTKLSSDTASAHVFHAVRHLLADDSFKYWEAADLQRLFSGVTSIDAPLGLIEDLAASPAFRPRVLAVRYCRLARFADGLPASTLASVTHVSGFFPGGSQPDDALLTDGRMLDALPALTHFGLDVLDLSSYNDESDDDDGYGGGDGLVPEALDLAALERTLRAVLLRPRIRVVAMRVAGDWAVHRPSVLTIVQRLQDARVYGWHDTRPMRSFAKEAQYAKADAWAGRSIWTESSQLWKPLQ